MNTYYINDYRGARYLQFKSTKDREQIKEHITKYLGHTTWSFISFPEAIEF